jgi:hypothetical protein
MENNFGDLVCSFQKSDTELIGAGFSTYRGNEYFYIRVFQQVLFELDNIIPTQKGITIKVDKFDAVYEAVQNITEVMTNDKVVKTIQKNNNEQIKIGVSEFRGNVYIYIRIYFKNKDGEYLPTKKGVNIPLAKYDELVEMMNKLSEYKK